MNSFITDQEMKLFVCKIIPRRYLGFGHERLNPEKVSEKAKLFMRAKTSVDSIWYQYHTSY